MVRFECYHGTSTEAARKILEEQRFLQSSKDEEWAGTGVYFFIDTDSYKELESKAYNNAEKWAIFHKRYKDFCVLQSEIEIDDASIFDLCNENHLEEFHRFREWLYSEAAKRALIDGVKLESLYSLPKKLDCLTINFICIEFGFSIVVRKCYIRSLSRIHGFPNYPKSDIPNCTILCIRDEKLILNTKCTNRKETSLS